MSFLVYKDSSIGTLSHIQEIGDAGDAMGDRGDAGLLLNR
jgi:hypothetical protein